MPRIGKMSNQAVIAIEQYTVEQIRAMSYNELIGLVRETNRTPGGNRAIAAIARRLFVDARSTVLDIGTSTGSTALELTRLTGCAVVGIDKNEAACRRRAGAPTSSA